MKRSLAVVMVSLIVLAPLFVGCNRNVKEDPEAKSVILTPVGAKNNTKLEKIKLTEGEEYVLRVKTEPLNVKVKSMVSSDEKVAKADAKTNTITAISKGKATIKVYVGRNNLEASLSVEVIEKQGEKKPAK